MNFEKNRLPRNPLVSVIIPALNSENTIGRCITSVKDQTYDPIQIIVVDAGSSDGTVEISKNLGVGVIEANIKNRAKQTNIGASSADGKYIYRLDSDVILSNKVVEECVFKCELENCEALSTYWGPDPRISFWAKIRKFEKDCYKYDSSRNVARFYKKTVFDSVGGYNENLVYGEDYDIHNRIQNNDFQICFCESEGLHLGEPKTLKEVVKEQYNYGKTIKEFLRENKSRGLVQVSPFRRSFFGNWKKFVKNPFLTVAFLFYEIVYYSSSIAGYLSYSLNGFSQGD